MSKNLKTLTYHFRLDSGLEKSFEVRLEYPSMQLVREPSAEDPPPWARLEFHQCPNCPLKKEDHPHCPIALNLQGLIDFFRHCISIELAEIRIVSDQREIRKHAPVQYGISSLMGVYMVTAGCPVMNKLRPMVFTHLPFSTVDETLYRAVAMYLVSQFLMHKRGEKADWNADGLVSIYEAVGVVNKTFIKRLLSISPKDASLNALGSLDCFASYTSVTLSDNFLEELEGLFSTYLDEGRSS